MARIAAQRFLEQGPGPDRIVLANRLREFGLGIPAPGAGQSLQDRKAAGGLICFLRGDQKPPEEHLEIRRLPILRGLGQGTLRPQARLRGIALHRAAAVEQHRQDMHGFRVAQFRRRAERTLALGAAHPHRTVEMTPEGFMLLVNPIMGVRVILRRSRAAT